MCSREQERAGRSGEGGGDLGVVESDDGADADVAGALHHDVLGLVQQALEGGDAAVAQRVGRLLAVEDVARERGREGDGGAVGEAADQVGPEVLEHVHVAVDLQGRAIVLNRDCLLPDRFLICNATALLYECMDHPEGDCSLAMMLHRPGNKNGFPFPVIGAESPNPAAGCEEGSA